MKCRDCDKQLMGGFKQEDGSHLCARCVVIEIERNSNRSWLTKIVEDCNNILSAKKRPSKAEVRKLRSMAKALLEVRQ